MIGIFGPQPTLWAFFCLGAACYGKLLLAVFDMMCYNKMNYADNMLTGLPKLCFVLIIH